MENIYIGGLNVKDNYYIEIKNKLVDNEVYKEVKDYSKKRNDLSTYYEVGKILAQAGKHYGEGIIKKYSKMLTDELGKGYTQTRLRYYRIFFEVFSKCPTLSDDLSYSHYCEIIWFEQTKMNYYIGICEKENLSVRELRERIKSNDYERLDENTKLKLANSKEEDKIGDFIKHSIVIKTEKEIISEKILHQVILENIVSFMKELGEGY